MSITQVNVSSPSSLIIYTDSAMGGTKDAIKASSATVYSVTVDNSANTMADSYVKLWNVASGSVTVGTTDPDEVIFVKASAIDTRIFYTGAAPGKLFNTALTAACVTTGGSAGSTSPTNPVVVSVRYQ